MVARWLPAAAVSLLLTGCQQGPRAVSPAPTVTSAAPAAASTAPPTETHRGLPNPRLTPGERGKSPTKATRPNPAVVRKVLEAYGATPGDARTEVIRLIPAELGGTNGEKNLFLTTPWFADLKSRLDAKLVHLVKSGQIKVEQAESDLTGNWVRATHKYYVRNYGSTDSAAARKIEDSNRW